LDPALILPYLIDKRAKRHPDRVILRDVGGDTRTYAQLNAAAGQWAGALQSINPNSERVATMMPTSMQGYEIWLGIGWRKLIEVPINPAYRGRMLHHILSDSKVSVLIIDSQYVDKLAGVDKIETLQNIIVTGERIETDMPYPFVWASDLLRKASPGKMSPDIKERDVALVLYTSGTTGLSKGVIMPWGQMYTYLATWMPTQNGTMGEDDIFYSTLPMFHTSGRMPLYTMAFLNGEVVMREFFSASGFWEDIDKFGCTTVFMLGATSQMIHRRPPNKDDAHHPLRNVAMVPLLKEAEDFKKRFGVRIYTVYGSTEAGVPIHSSPDWTLDNTETCGKAAAAYDLRLVDGDDREVGLGEVGELLVRPREPWTMMTAYLDDGDKTARAFTNLWFHTGDGFTKDEAGNFYFVDRLKDVIRRRGENISSREVELEVLAHEDVLDCCAIAVASELAEDEVMVLVEPKPGRRIDPHALCAFLLPRMPYFMLPRYIEEVSELPRTETAKVKKHELRARGVTQATWDREKAGFKVNRLS
jgi:carnitine-CoA ligase